MIDRVRVLVFNKSGSVIAYNRIVSLLMELGYVVSKTELEEIFVKSNGLEPKKFDVAVVIQGNGSFRISSSTKTKIECIYTKNSLNDLNLMKIRLAHIQKS